MCLFLTLFTYYTLRPHTPRYVRIQLEEPDPLSIADVQVYQKSSNLLRDYIGGSPIVGGTYQAETTMNELFQGMTASGPWVLRVVDKTKEGLQRDHESLPYVMRNGVGAFDDWQLAITDMNNTKRFYNMDLSVEVKTLPRYHALSLRVRTRDVWCEGVPRGRVHPRPRDAAAPLGVLWVLR